MFIVNRTAWELFQAYPEAIRFHVDHEVHKETREAQLAIYINGEALPVRIVPLGYPAVDPKQWRQHLADLNRLQQALNWSCNERRDRLITEIQGAIASCNARVAAMTAENEVRSSSGLAPAYDSGPFFSEANQLETVLEKLRKLL